MRLPEQRRTPDELAKVLLNSPAGAIPVSAVAHIDMQDGPNQIVRENGLRLIVIYANSDHADVSDLLAAVRTIVNATPLPQDSFVIIEGQFLAQEQAMQLLIVLSVLSFSLIFLVLYVRYQSLIFAGIIMCSLPMALTGAVVAMWLTNMPLSVASVVGFITLTGIAARNGILKISHYLNFAGMKLKSLAPVLMTSMVS